MSAGMPTPIGNSFQIAEATGISASASICRTDRRAVAALLAHELHHAMEVAPHPEVISQATIERL
jgi:hypothetical protein